MTNGSAVDVLAPENEDGTRAVVLRWCRAVGDRVEKNQPLLELETDKITVEVPAPASGTLAAILMQEGAEVSGGDVLARLQLLDRDAPVGASTGAAGATVEHSGDPQANLRSAPAAGERLSPAVRRLMQELAFDPHQIEGTGEGGRITADDVLRAGSARKPAAQPARAEGRVAHGAMRRRIAENMVESMGTAPHVTTLFEANLAKVLEHKRRHEAEWQQRGVKPTLTAYFVWACARSLRAVPQVNASWHADGMQLHPHSNIGVGTALGNEGLIVPVIHEAESLDLAATAGRLNELVRAARDGRLTAADIRGSTFAISNHGVGGSLLAAPIVIHRPNVAILGIGKLQKRVQVAAVEGEDVIRIAPMCYLSLSIDHRALDAFQANAFLADLVARLENWPAD